MKKRAYHHGDLRSALVEEGLKLLKESDAAGVSLRELARRAGVSATAVYRHFPDKQSLLFALCTRGADMLAETQRQAMASASDQAGAFAATGRAYVRFALANPALFRMMMSTKPSDDVLAADLDRVSEAMRMLRKTVVTLSPTDASDAEVRARVVRNWAIVHGLAILMLDGQVPADEALIDAVIEA